MLYDLKFVEMKYEVYEEYEERIRKYEEYEN